MTPNRPTATDPASMVRWQPSLGRMMFGVGLISLFLTDETRLIVFFLAYFLYPIAILWIVVTNRHRSIASNRPNAWNLIWVAFSGLLIGWPLLFILWNPQGNIPLMSLDITIIKILVFVPVVLASIVAWLLIPLPSLERRR